MDNFKIYDKEDKEVEKYYTTREIEDIYNVKAVTIQTYLYRRQIFKAKDLAKMKNSTGGKSGVIWLVKKEAVEDKYKNKKRAVM